MPTIQKAVVPAAGRGTRLQPLTDYLPKPMLPLGKKPVLQHITEELIEAGITEIAVIVQSDHDLIFDYFSKFPEIEFITDDSVSGPGGAILHAEEFVDGDDFITVFADAPATGNGRDKHIENLLHIKNAEEAEAVVSIYRVPGAEASSRGVVTLEDPNDSVTDPARIVDIIEKPPEIPKGEQWASACRYVLSPDIFRALKYIDSDENDELQLTTAIRYQLQQGKRVMGVPLPKNMKRHDTGNFQGYFEAFGEITNKHS